MVTIQKEQGEIQIHLSMKITKNANDQIYLIEYE